MELLAFVIVFFPVTLGLTVSWTKLGNKPGWRLASAIAYGLLALFLLILMLTYSFNFFPILITVVCIYASIDQYDKYQALLYKQG